MYFFIFEKINYAICQFKSGKKFKRPLKEDFFKNIEEKKARKLPWKAIFLCNSYIILGGNGARILYRKIRLVLLWKIYGSPQKDHTMQL